ncbi:MAG: leucine-rich repeat protein [Clostridia bacterium]|nr:leucine-rich repeat protein [Clostridia bacterium]
MKRLMLVFLMILCLVPMGSWAEKEAVEWFNGNGEIYNSRGEHFCYEIEDDHAVLTCYWIEKDKPQPSVIEVPATLSGYPVTAIGWCAFDNWDADDFPDGRHQAYDGRQVECIVIPEGVTTLEDGAFCEAEHVGVIHLPSTLTEIHTGLCFEHVDAEISFPNGNDVFRVDNGFLIDGRQNALIYCNSTAREHPLPRVTRIETHALDHYHGGKAVLEFPDSVEYIGGYNAYDNVDLETIIVPGSVVEIADHGLYCNSATSIVLHEGLKRIGAFAFSETDAGEIIVPATVEWIGYGAFTWEGLEPVIQNPDCIWETEAQYNSRIWAEASANDEVVWSYDGWPLRTVEIIRDKDGRDFLRVTMKDGSGLMYISTQLPAFASLDEYHCGNTGIFLEYPVGLPEDATQEDADEAERYFLTFEYINGDWWLMAATNGWDWTVDIEDGIFRFGDYYSPDPAWLWETESVLDPENACRLTEFYFDELEEMAADYDEAMPNRYSLHPEDFE